MQAEGTGIVAPMIHNTLGHRSGKWLKRKSLRQRGRRKAHTDYIRRTSQADTVNLVAVATGLAAGEVVA